MWVPATESEIEAAIANQGLRETSGFEAKQQLPAPGRNKDLAKGLCAMTVDGGEILYGVGGNDPTRPDQLTPFDLAGAAERIDQIAQTAIHEPPSIEIRDIRSEREPGKGFLLVVVPASPRAPHMLVIDGDNRYWGRGETGNRILSEAEVARLYMRRERWERDRGEHLEQLVRELPFDYGGQPVDEIGPMVVTIWPVAGPEDLVARAAGGADVREFVRTALPQHAAGNDPYPGQGTTGLEGARSPALRGAGRWVFGTGRAATSRYQAELELGADGEFVFWHSPTINDIGQADRPHLLLLEQSVTRAVHQTIACASFLYQRGGYHGATDVAVGILELGRASAASLHGGFDRGPILGANEYRRHARFTAAQLAHPKSVTRQLLAPLYEAISVRDYDPYAESAFPDPDPEGQGP
jgi:hypothetical protein